METTLHRQLKTIYAGDDAAVEQRVGSYRIDAVRDGRLIEIQQASLAALKHKTANLLIDHEVTIVKPVVRRVRIVRMSKLGGRASRANASKKSKAASVLSGRFSPKQGKLHDVFADLVHFTAVFPHPRLTLELVLVDVEERRGPVAVRRWGRPERIMDRSLLAVVETKTLRSAADLWQLLGSPAGETFTSADLANWFNIPRWSAQQAAYCLRECGAAQAMVRRKSGWVYQKAG